mmetsp:Transcript_9954/g.24511  ORF Transcript_9954/g.24511 Transcript_9954/m.24511 type:complete len:259 (+) Transcript_9954:125-901(+)|eukprot:CAMPEP_0114515344 /NCGR_PEP_ID=MMETSP0109-20121206/16682_1 /TAXON_ID=29199 /ORGANISM="Chlorarachnion reptans, Strain CCCM449" /LENGTH=258 /DNA_ID=CAMNT_0001695535 /DNA_START=96 /DNA_END=872 /DNA_ORIENTATION=+
MTTASNFQLPRSFKEAKAWKVVKGWVNSDAFYQLKNSVRMFLKTEAILGSIEGFTGAKTAEFKVVVLGKKNSGKTSLINNLCDVDVSKTAPTHGVAETNAYWPVKLTNGSEPIIVRLQFWDAGVWCLTDERSAMLQKLKLQQSEFADAVLYVCTSTDYKSFTEVQNMIRLNSEPKPLPKTKVLVMTRTDQWVRRAVNSRNLRSIESEYSVRSYGISNVIGKVAHEKKDSIELLNFLCCKLLQSRNAEQLNAAARKGSI